jgi:hypothetical protein
VGARSALGARTRISVAIVAGAVALVAPACGGDGGSQEAFCAEVAEVPALESVLARFSEADPQVLADRIERARAAYQDLADAAPDAIGDETDDVVEVVEEIFAAVEDHPTDPSAAADQLRVVMADHPEVEAARREVADYALEACGLRLDPTLGSSDDASTTTTAADPDAGDGASSTTIAEGETTTTGG